MTNEELSKLMQDHFEQNPDHRRSETGCCRELNEICQKYRSERRTEVKKHIPSNMSAKLMYLNVTNERIWRGELGR